MSDPIWKLREEGKLYLYCEQCGSDVFVQQYGKVVKQGCGHPTTEQVIAEHKSNSTGLIEE